MLFEREINFLIEVQNFKIKSLYDHKPKMTKNVKLVKITRQSQDKVKEGIEKYFKLKNYQTYFPVMTFWEEFQNNSYSHQLFILDSKYQLDSIQRPSEKQDSDRVFLGYLRKKGENKPQTQKQNIYFKVNPILEPVHTMMNKYQTQKNNPLPNIFEYLTAKKVNSPHNFSYVETLFCYLASRLVEKGRCPAFPYFYGTYLGVMESYKQNITDDYQSIKKCSWFNQNRGDLFQLEKLTLEEKLAKQVKILDKVDSQEQKRKDKDVGAVDLNFDDLSLEGHQTTQEIKDRFLEGDVRRLNLRNQLKISMEEVESEGDSESEKGFLVQLEELEELDDSGSESESEDESDAFSDLSDFCQDLLEHDDDIFDEELDDSYYYIKFENYPVQLIAMESLNLTLDELLKENQLTELEWLGILFQICFGLAVAQKAFQFTHNDLHSSNIMFKPSKIPYLYYFFKGVYYRIPTFGKITKIIDFARAVYTVDGHQFFSDVFKHDGDAEGQYTYPYYPNTQIKYPPNPSFDLCYLAITIKEHFEIESPLYLLLEKWMTDKYGNNLGFHPINFDLYLKIAHNVNNAVPKNQLKDSLFNQFRIRKEDIPKNTYVYYF